MKAKIDKDGCLHLERAGKFKIQCCPYSTRFEPGGSSYCGDWCPLFEEPTEDPNNKVVAIFLCERSIYADELIDER